MKFVTQYNFDSIAPENYETPVGESLTVPDLSISVRDLLDNFSRGASISEHLHDSEVYYDPYQDDETFDNAYTDSDGDYDLYDRVERGIEVQNKYEEIKSINEKSRKQSRARKETTEELANDNSETTDNV